MSLAELVSTKMIHLQGPQSLGSSPAVWSLRLAGLEVQPHVFIDLFLSLLALAGSNRSTVHECDKKFSVFGEGLRFLKGTGSRQGLSLVS